MLNIFQINNKIELIDNSAMKNLFFYKINNINYLNFFFFFCNGIDNFFFFFRSEYLNFVNNFVFFKKKNYYKKLLSTDNVKIIKTIKIVKKNNFFLSRLINFFKNNFSFKKNIFKIIFKLNNFLLFSSLINKIIKKNKNKPYLSKFFPRISLLYDTVYLRNWFFIVGGLISPYYWGNIDLQHLNKNNFQVNKNFLHSLKINNALIHKIDNNKIVNLVKKLLINNFFYLNKINFNLSDLLYTVKLKIPVLDRKNFIQPFVKPYLFFNNNNIYKLTTYSNDFLINLYRTYGKIFLLIKKFKFKNKNNFDNQFKKIKNDQISNLSFFKINHVNPNIPFLLIFANKNLLKKKLYLSNIVEKDSYMLKIKKIKKIKKRVQLRWFKLFLKSKKRFNLLTKLFSFINFTVKNKIKNFNYYRFFNKSGISRYKLKKIKKLILWVNLLNLSKDFKHKNFFSKNDKLIINRKNKIFSINKFFLFPIFNIFTAWANKLILINFYFNKLLNLSLNKKLNLKIFFLQKPIINTKSENNLSIPHNGFLYTSDNYAFMRYRSENISLLKKNIYSFSQKNEMQKFILRRYIKNKFLSFSVDNAENLLNDESENEFLIHKHPQIMNLLINDSDTARSVSLSHIRSLISEELQSSSWLHYSTQMELSRNFSDIASTFSIKRIKFKPGYMTLWRNVREVLKTSLNLKFKYQHRLTNYLFKYQKFVRFKTFLVLELRINNILLKSRLLPDLDLSNLFITNGLVFVNGWICRNITFSTFIGDFIQLVTTLKYYILYRWFLNWSLKKKIRLKNKSKKKLASFNLTDEKQKPGPLPLWILYNKNIIDDVPRYLEIDYFTLSIMVLYEPFLWIDTTPYSFFDVKFGVINLYNWKYIT